MAFAQIVQRLHGRLPEPPAGVHPAAFVHPTAKLGADVTVEPFAVIGMNTVVGDRCRIAAGAKVGAGCRLGPDTVLHPNVVLYDGCVVGQRVTIHANSAIGADGFGYRLHDGRHVKVPQLGHVEIEDDVEIGACTTIDRGTFGPTRIGAGTKIDNLVQVAHNCQVGRHNLFVSQMGIAGSSSTGDHVVIAGQAGVRDHVHIGDRAVIGAMAGVTKDVAAGQHMLGAPARPEREVKRIVMTTERLPEIRRDVARLKKHLGLPDEPAAPDAK
jgi:UDP-3-O-[3-hydroxymyristoyl] glucosamine N-acyltransferase